ncbi:MAG: hypothetical protein HXS46_03990 [Theionarchaea archaeon]|nr:hypothetical protein [Theionarchaea archaeon]
MRCSNCGREFDNPWGFCPYCGSFAEGFEENFVNMARMLGGKAVIKQEGDSYIVILEIEGERYAFKITPIELEEEVVAPPQTWAPPLEPRKEREFEKTKEPETEINEVNNKIYIKVNLKDVAPEDIEIDELEDSIEIRGYKGKTLYFKLIPIPEEQHVISRELLPGEVIITLEKAQ